MCWNVLCKSIQIALKEASALFQTSSEIYSSFPNRKETRKQWIIFLGDLDTCRSVCRQKRPCWGTPPDTCRRVRVVHPCGALDSFFALFLFCYFFIFLFFFFFAWSQYPLETRVWPVHLNSLVVHHMLCGACQDLSLAMSVKYWPSASCSTSGMDCDTDVRMDGIQERVHCSMLDS